MSGLKVPWGAGGAGAACCLALWHPQQLESTTAISASAPAWTNEGFTLFPAFDGAHSSASAAQKKRGGLIAAPLLDLRPVLAYWPGQTLVMSLCSAVQPFADVLVGAPKYGIIASDCGCQVNLFWFTVNVP